MQALEADDVAVLSESGVDVGTVKRTSPVIVGVVSKALGPYAEPDDYLVQVRSSQLADLIGREVVVMPVARWETK